MTTPLHAFNYTIDTEEQKIVSFLTVVGNAINDMERDLVDYKLDQKIENGKLNLKIKLKFSDGTEMQFCNATKFGFNLNLVELSEQDALKVMQQMGIPMEDEYEEKLPCIGFALPTEDELEMMEEDEEDWEDE